MFKKLDSKYNLALTLAIISGVSALLISLVHGLTAPVIEENQEKQTLALYSELFPEMTDFNEVSSEDGINIIEVVSGKEVIGSLCSTSGTNGYGGISALVGYDTTGKVLGVEYPKFNQTPGFGDKVKNPKYIKEQYIGDSADAISADTASGATYSSKLVLELVESCSINIEVGSEE